MDVSKFLREHERELTAALPSRISFELCVSEEPLSVDADAMQMHQVLTNLAINAADAMPDGGVLRVTASRVNGSVEIAVSDTGKGIAPEHLPEVFEPLFTTKPKGTGLGLAVVQQLVVLNHGAITVESTPGAGTTFRIVLPATASRPQMLTVS